MANASAAIKRGLGNNRGKSIEATPSLTGERNLPDQQSPITPAFHPNAMLKPLLPARLLIASLGNPKPYLETRHSAGHMLINSIAHNLSCSPFIKSREYGNALIAKSFEKPDWLLWQSPSLMNVSGPPLRDALHAFIKNGPPPSVGDSRVGLVILHDDLESSPGTIRERGKQTSHQGHNGLKSVRTTLNNSHMWDKLAMIKIGMGIGRPGSHQSKEVADYVLKKMTWDEKQQIEDGADQAIKLIETFAQKIGPLDPKSS